MSRKLWYVAAGFCCLALAQLYAVLSLSFAVDPGGGSQWMFELFNPAAPFQLLYWLIVTVAIGLVLSLTVNLRHRFGIGAWTSLIVATVIGVMIMPLIIGVIANMWENESLSSSIYYFLDPGHMTAFAMISFITVCLGLFFGRHLINDLPAGSSQSFRLFDRLSSFVSRHLTVEPKQLLRTSADNGT